MDINHKSQKEAWEREHAAPTALLQMDSADVSSGVKKFYEFLLSKGGAEMSGLEMGCGKGRNVIWLAKQDGITKASGFDFSENAIHEAQRRAEADSVSSKTDLRVGDATVAWPYADASFDFAFDCFAASDIEDKAGREFAAKEMARVVKPSGHILVYELSTDDEYHKMMLEKSPGPESGSFINPAGKFEKVFTERELLSMYAGLTPVVSERVDKVAEFYGKPYQCHHFWLIFKKS